MDFGALPPEVNSARMYAGAGSAPLVAAASAWNGLAAELHSAAADYDSVVTRLTSEEWLGSASSSMAQAAAPYVAWMNTTAAQAEQAATHARAAATAYEAALAATVPPPQVAANRTQLQALVSTNLIGQNTPAIAVTEAQYGEMWAQNAAAMYGYAGRSAAAARVTSFAPPQQTTNPAGQAAQGAAVAQATGTAGHAQTSKAIAAAQNALQQLATPTAGASSSSTASTSGLDQALSSLYGLLGLKYTPGSPIANLLAPWTTYIGPIANTESLAHYTFGAWNGLQGVIKNLTPAAAKAASDGAKAAAGLPGLGGLLGGGAPVSVGLGNAATVGRLSVPSAWAGPAAPVTPAAPLPISSVSAAPDAAGAGNLLGGMPLAGAGAGAAGNGPRYGFRPTVMARPPFAG
ncbi:hypothetical protein A5707_13670 [Mycobacterium kyorinense]|uniref:PPE family protein n=1 Tax=Mycobacterium kyorinense TaxID=487514 RepID=A0A1A2ZLW0_9MYCO|nr:PPE family protein [Mycobacterium kyorinense]OBI51589.1 hypothetical protein A5707_13670 [Mycobacterium kyorinense]